MNKFKSSRKRFCCRNSFHMHKGEKGRGIYFLFVACLCLISPVFVYFYMPSDSLKVLAAGSPSLSAQEELSNEDPYVLERLTLTEDFADEDMPYSFRRILLRTKILRGGSYQSFQGVFSNVFQVYGLCYEKPDGTKSFYLADEESVKNQEIQVLGADGRHYLCMPVDVSLKLRKGFNWTTRAIAGYMVYGWYYDGEGEDFFQIYLRNENQEEYIYQYDTSEKTLQRYHDTSLSDEEYLTTYEEAEQAASTIFSRETIVFLIVTLTGGAICLFILLR